MALRKNGSTVVIPGEVYVDMYPTIVRESSGGTAPTFEFLGTGGGVSRVGGWGFGHTADDIMQFNLEIPHGVKPGSLVEFHIHWTPLVANGNVAWSFSYSGLPVDLTSDGAAWPNVVTLPTIYSPATNVAGRHLFTEIAADIGGLAYPSAVLLCAVRRLGSSDGLDTNGGMAVVVSIGGHVLIDRDGSTNDHGPWDT
jgi:hypothetical protein